MLAGQLRGKGSNLDFGIQSPASCQLDDPAKVRGFKGLSTPVCALTLLLPAGRKNPLLTKTTGVPDSVHGFEKIPRKGEMFPRREDGPGS